MRIRIPTVIGFLIGIVLSLMVAKQCFSQPHIPKGEVIGGFERLSWGVSVEQAQAIYRDLYFGNYVIEDSKQEPSKIYYRKDETGEIDGVAFDAIQYWFKDNRFHGIRAVMHSKIGPRALITRSEEFFDRLHQSLIRKYGKPTKFNESYFIDFVTVVRDAEWERGDATIVLRYKGPEGTNEDQLIFELREGGRN